jgi:CRISPR/Cas system Type II protein with McrA/HNH and RuvC-like nuclease domain
MSKKQHLFDTRKPEEISKEFIGRNLSDTRYIGQILLTELQKKYKALGIDVIVTTGKFTTYVKKVLKLDDKNRDEFKHHGVDAIAIAFSAFLPKNLLSFLTKYSNKVSTLIDTKLSIEEN